MENAAPQPLALVCIDNQDYCNYVHQTLSALGFNTQASTDIDDSIVRIRVATYDVIVIMAEMGGKPLEENPVWEETLRTAPALRRKEFVALVSSTLPTRNEMVEFIYSVELVVNAADVANLGILVRQGATTRQNSYALFNALSRPKALLR